MSRPDEFPTTIRPASLNDLDALVAIDAACFSGGIAYSRDEIAALLRSASVFTSIAEPCIEGQSDSPIAGFSALGWFGRRGDRTGELITIDVLPQFRCKGIGLKLYLDVERRFRIVGGKFVCLHVAIDNQPALSFYERIGYRILMRVPRYYLNRIDAWQMEKAVD